MKTTYAMKIRVKDLIKGDRFLLMGHEYKVRHIDENGISYYPTSSSSSCASRLLFGRKSMQFVELIDRSPEVFKLTAQADGE
jgi:hypothetical protein